MSVNGYDAAGRYRWRSPLDGAVMVQYADVQWNRVSTKAQVILAENIWKDISKRMGTAF